MGDDVARTDTTANKALTRLDRLRCSKFQRPGGVIEICSGIEIEGTDSESIARLLARPRRRTAATTTLPRVVWVTKAESCRTRE